MRVLTEAEQNRLIIDNMGLVEPVAAHYRGRKGIPFEELVAAGREGLVSAARHWEGWGNFVGFAIKGITNSLSNFVHQWQPMEAQGASSPEELDEEFSAWQNFISAPPEYWTSLAATPEELLLNFEKIGSDRQALSSSMIGLTARDRQIIYARFLREPRQTLDSIARDHKISYSRVVYIVKRSLIKMLQALKKDPEFSDYPSDLPDYAEITVLHLKNGRRKLAIRQKGGPVQQVWPPS